MLVEIYSDLVCPWCYIGEARFDRALETFPHRDQVEVVLRPFQLDPEAPVPGTPLISYLEGRYGAQARAMMEQAGEAAEAEGLAVDWEQAQVANTLDAHRLLRMVVWKEGAEVQRQLAKALFRLHFVQGGDLSDPEVLASLAERQGLDRQEVGAFLASDEGMEATRDAMEYARGIGISSVPTFVFQGRWGIRGAQPPEAFTRMLDQVLERMEEGADLEEGADGQEGADHE